MRQWLSSIHDFVSLPVDNPVLLKSKYHAFGRQLPLICLIFLSNVWTIAVLHLDDAPLLLALCVPVPLTGLCVLRVRHWWRLRDTEPTPDFAIKALRRVNPFVALCCFAFVGWTFALYPYGDDHAQRHMLFTVAITFVCSFFSLMRLRSAALICMITFVLASVVFYFFMGMPSKTAFAINLVVTSFAVLALIHRNHKDFSELVNARADLCRKQEEQSRLLRMINDMPVAVMTIDPRDFTINYANEASRELIRAIEHLLPLKADNLIGTSIDLFHRHPEHQRRIIGDKANLPHNARIRLGTEVLDLKISAVTAADGSDLGPMLTWALVTKQVEADNRIRQLAHYDTLTGLANRTTFRERLETALGEKTGQVGLLFIDLDGFKLVNDTKGHSTGDALLVQVAERLRKACGEPGMVLGRLGGDEFAIAVSGTSAGELEHLAARIIPMLSEPYMLAPDYQAQIGASIGLAVMPFSADTVDDLLARADIALYAAKDAGKGTYKMFSTDMEIRIQERIRLQALLDEALLSKQGLFVFYQPIIDIRTNEITAREALVRWHHPARGWISPGVFVPIAEQSGLIDRLGDFVLNAACREAAGWQDGARVAVNVSAAQLGKGTIVPAVMAALLASSLAPGRLEIEVTETAMLDDEHDGIGDLRRLRALGVRVALDDFGTGYSSLTHLRSFPFDKVKIDGSFVKDAIAHPEAAAIVRAITDLGQRLGVTIVAEGVETEAHLARAIEEGCSEVQGYLYGRPVPSAGDKALVEALNRPAVAAE